MSKVNVTRETPFMLTDTDWRLLEALNKGTKNKELAAVFCKSEFTIRNKLSMLYKKINVNSRSQAAFWYRENQIQQIAMFVRRTS
jgi:DNA-binding NarL/FixJ family response regulator